MTEKSSKQISLIEAQKLLGLEISDSRTYQLPTVILKILGNNLEITRRNFSKHLISEDTVITTSPFEYFVQGKCFLFRSENDQLIIEQIEV